MKESYDCNIHRSESFQRKVILNNKIISLVQIKGVSKRRPCHLKKVRPICLHNVLSSLYQSSQYVGKKGEEYLLLIRSELLCCNTITKHLRRRHHNLPHLLIFDLTTLFNLKTENISINKFMKILTRSTPKSLGEK